MVDEARDTVAGNNGVYVALVGIILLLAASLFDKSMRQSAGLQRNIGDIERALKAGERNGMNSRKQDLPGAVFGGHAVAAG